MGVLASISSRSSGNRLSAISSELPAHQAPKLVPVSTTSFPPEATNVLISVMISSLVRDLCRPRACTVRQNVQKLSHPV